MKHVKTYEELNIGKPEIGDYVICQDLEYEEEDGERDFLLNIVGKIENIKKDPNHGLLYSVDLGESKEALVIWGDTIQDFNIKEIKYWSKDRDDLETIVQANKYNL